MFGGISCSYNDQRTICLVWSAVYLVTNPSQLTGMPLGLSLVSFVTLTLLFTRPKAFCFLKCLQRVMFGHLLWFFSVPKLFLKYWWWRWNMSLTSFGWKSEFMFRFVRIIATSYSKWFSQLPDIHSLFDINKRLL